jgi:ABC-type uncharacterized transport system permease subunit
MNIDLEPWFLSGVSLFAISSLFYIFNAWGQSLNTKWPKRILDFSLGFWGLLLVCWLIHTGGNGASRLWFGISALAIGLTFRLINQRVAIDSLGAAVAAFSALLAIFSYQLAPASDSLGVLNDSADMPFTLALHIALAMAGLTAFAVSAAMSGLYLVVSRRLKSKQLMMDSGRLPSLSVLDAFNLKSLLVGFPLYTGALLIGSAYAFQGTGELSLSYMVAIASWIIYGGVLQARLTAGWRGRRAAFLTLVAFIGLLLVAASYSFR